MKNDIEKITRQEIEKLFALLGIEATFELSVTEEEIAIVCQTEDGGMLIGYHGETLEALQLILSLCLAKKREMFTRVSLEIGDYKKSRTEWIHALVTQTKEQVIEGKEPIVLPDLKSWERRIVHTLLQDDPQVLSESQGEGRERVLTIRLKS